MLILDGEELVGAKQNRIVNVTILVAPQSEVVIPVSCIEAGRWGYSRPSFAAAGRVLNPEIRYRKADAVTRNLKEKRLRFSDQRTVWDGVDKMLYALGSASPTRALSDGFENRANVIADYLAAFERQPGQVGVIYRIAGVLASLDLFGSERTFARAFPKLVRGSALQALAGYEKDGQPTFDEPHFLRPALAAPADRFPERQFKRNDVLEPVADEEDPFQTLRRGPFGGPDDLRRVLTFEKIKGELTNVFYSMEASNTDFYAHQFKPVMRFIESAAGRLLIADEVGLGKTIEATYIWKELQARQGARRLLIVRPAMLRDKWRNDLRNRFDIPVEVVTSQALLEKVQEVASRRSPDAFVFVTSLKGLRPPADFHDVALQSTRAKLARLLDEHTATADYALFDYVVIDEAHYLRNPSTGNNRLGRLLREASYHLVLLTATPIQIARDNLYQLLRLVDPDVFYDSSLFQEMLQADACIVRAQRALWRHPPDLNEAADAISDAEATDYFSSDPVLGRIRSQLSAATAAETRVEMLRLLESRSLLAQFMTRSRKREVLEKRVERAPHDLLPDFPPVIS